MYTRNGEVWASTRRTSIPIVIRHRYADPPAFAYRAGTKSFVVGIARLNILAFVLRQSVASRSAEYFLIGYMGRKFGEKIFLSLEY